MYSQVTDPNAFKSIQRVKDETGFSFVQVTFRRMILPNSTLSESEGSCHWKDRFDRLRDTELKLFCFENTS